MALSLISAVHVQICTSRSLLVMSGYVTYFGFFRPKVCHRKTAVRECTWCFWDPSFMKTWGIFCASFKVYDQFLVLDSVDRRKGLNLLREEFCNNIQKNFSCGGSLVPSVQNWLVTTLLSVQPCPHVNSLHTLYSLSVPCRKIPPAYKFAGIPAVQFHGSNFVMVVFEYCKSCAWVWCCRLANKCGNFTVVQK